MPGNTARGRCTASLHADVALAHTSNAPESRPHSRALHIESVRHSERGDAEFVEKASKFFGGTMMEARRLLEPDVGEGGDDDEVDVDDDDDE